jgi:hypothetical protein
MGRRSLPSNVPFGQSGIDVMVMLRASDKQWEGVQRVASGAESLLLLDLDGDIVRYEAKLSGGVQTGSIDQDGRVHRGTLDGSSGSTISQAPFVGDEGSDLEALNAQLDGAIEDRVAAHRERAAGLIDVPEYRARLADARRAEDEIEPRRQALGALRTRAWELAERDGELPSSLRHAARAPRETDAAAIALHEARKLCDRHGADLADGRAPAGGMRGSHSAPCRPRVEWQTSKGVGVALQTAAGYEADCAWHSWRAEHGYGSAAGQAGVPPRAQSRRGATQWFSWARLGRMHRDELAARADLQRALEEAAG